MRNCSLLFIECRIAEWMWKTVPFILLVIGTGGNMLNIAILSRRALRRYSTSVYYIVLAISDTLVLWTAVPVAYYRFLLSENYLSLSDIHCRFTLWITFSGAATSAWTIVNLTIERVLLTIWPIKAKVKMSPMFALKVSIGTALMIQLLTSHLVFTRTLYTKTVNINNTFFHKKRTCEINSEESRVFLNTYWNIIVLICFNMLPMVTIISGNLAIGILLFKLKRKIHPESTFIRPNLTREKQAVKLLFIVSCFFVIGTCPYCVYYALKSKATVENEMAKDSLVNVSVNILLFSHFTFNFAMYFARGKQFRQELNKITLSICKTLSVMKERLSAKRQVQDLTPPKPMRQQCRRPSQVEVI